MSKNTRQYIEEVERYSARNYHPLPVVIREGEGVWVTDVEGKKYMDMLSAYSALNQGHKHPRLLAAVQRQLNTLTLTSRAFHNNRMGPFLKKLTQISGYDKALLMNTGAEAVETSIKAARRWGYQTKNIPRDKAEILICENNFHGRTTTIISFSTDPDSQNGFGPFTPGFRVIPFGDSKALEAAITKNTVAFLVEPIQGEAGVIIPPHEYLRHCYEITQKNKILLIADEIQTGLGRTGKLFCYEHEGIQPDMALLGKALGGGVYPISAMLTRKEIMDTAFYPGNHGSTFGGNPLACAVASTTLDIILQEKLPDQASELGEFFLEELRKIKSPWIREVRGRGLFIALELQPTAGHARDFSERLMRQGILVKDTHGFTIRLTPPLIITHQEIEWAVEKIKKVFDPPSNSD